MARRRWTNLLKRNNAARVLGEKGDRRAVDHLIAALKDKDDRGGRLLIIQALGETGDRRAIEPLLSLKDEKDYIRVAAEEALKDLGWNP